jgi:hypothetical protein
MHEHAFLCRVIDRAGEPGEQIRDRPLFPEKRDAIDMRISPTRQIHFAPASGQGQELFANDPVDPVMPEFAFVDVENPAVHDSIPTASWRPVGVRVVSREEVS